MTRLFKRRGKLVIMDRREPRMGKCEMCGAVDDLRPYGPKHESICFECAMKDEPMAARRFREMMEGSD